MVGVLCLRKSLFLSALTIGVGAVVILQSTRAEAARPQKVGGEVYVSQDTKMFSEPTKFGVPVALLKTGLPLKVIRYSSSDDWIKVQTPSGRTGWLLVRLTTQAQRRTLPANTQFEEEATRGPASTGEVVADDGSGDGAKTWELSLAPEYLNQLSREKASGFGLHLGGFKRLTSNGALGAALSWHRFSKSMSQNSYTYSRSSHRLSAEFLYRYRFADFRVDAGFGYALDKSSVSTIDDTTGNPVPDSGSTTYNGSGSESSLSMRISPRYVFPMSRGLKLGVQVTYLLDWAMGSGEGNFAAPDDTAASPPYHFLGFGLSLSMDL